MDFSSWFRKKRAGSDGHPRYRPVVEALEDRQLLSGGFGLVNLASNVPGLAPVTDSSVANPWGIASSPTGPFWFAENGSGVSDVLDGRGQPFALTVTFPAAPRSEGAPTGIVFNSGTGFKISEQGVSRPARFLFASTDGTISAWSAVVDSTRALLAVDNSSSGAAYAGLALATDATGASFLYAADFRRATIDVFDQDFKPIVRPGAFRDPNLPDGFAPFNVQNLNGLLFVAYAQQNEKGSDDAAGQGHGFIDIYDPAGRLVTRFASRGALNSPWGLALAPAGFGPFGGALLVGNNGDGHINAYDPGTGTLLGQLANDQGIPLAIPNLWALKFGNGHVGGDADTLFFTAGLDVPGQGLFGAVQASERRGADTGGSGAFDPGAPGEPGDYPLPPRDGPAFHAPGDPVLATADLLALRESSLVLVPTLSSVLQPGPGLEGRVPVVPGAGISASPAMLTAVAPASAILGISADGLVHQADGLPGEAVALRTFLDLTPSPGLPHVAELQSPDDDLDIGGFPKSSTPDLAAGAERPLSESHARGPQSEPGKERQGPGALSSDHLETRSAGTWTRLIHVFSVISIPTLWICWVKHQRHAGTADGDQGVRLWVHPSAREQKASKDRVRGLASVP